MTKLYFTTDLHCLYICQLIDNLNFIFDIRMNNSVIYIYECLFKCLEIYLGFCSLVNMFNFLIYYFIFHVHWCFAYVCLSEDVTSPRTGGTDNYELPHGCWVLNAGCLEE